MDKNDDQRTPLYTIERMDKDDIVEKSVRKHVLYLAKMALQSMVDEQVEYMKTNCLGNAEKQQNVIQARYAIVAIVDYERSFL